MLLAAPFANAGMSLAVMFGIKPLKFFIDNVFRDKVTPVSGSVVYCDLGVLLEHSGVYVGDGRISNIEVTGFAQGEVKCSNPLNFTSKSVFKGIYVSCDGDGATGHSLLAAEAESRVGEQSLYGLVFNNCHQFCEKCIDEVNLPDVDVSFLGRCLPASVTDTPEPTISSLKNKARRKLGATKWRLWDWDGMLARSSTPEPDWKAHRDHFRDLPLNRENVQRIREELAQASLFEEEIADENIPSEAKRKLAEFRKSLDDISRKYDQVKGFLALCPGTEFSYSDLENLAEDFTALAAMIGRNAGIRELARKMGRNHVSVERKRQARVPEASRNEVHGTCLSDDLMRLLPGELVALEDAELEMLFYARLLEKNLLTYELSGITYRNVDEVDVTKKRTGPVVACLDTSDSMAGTPLLKAKAALLAISQILRQEDRSLHVILFGSTGQTREFHDPGNNDSAGLLKFLKSGFGGGTDFETPLKRAFDIVQKEKDYEKADILMLTDGKCSISDAFARDLVSRKSTLDCSVYTVLCAGSAFRDGFSDDVVEL